MRVRVLVRMGMGMGVLLMHKGWRWVLQVHGRRISRHRRWISLKLRGRILLELRRRVSLKWGQRVCLERRHPLLTHPQPLMAHSRPHARKLEASLECPGLWTVDPSPFGRWFDAHATLQLGHMRRQISRRNALHAKDLQVDCFSTGNRVGHGSHGLLVHLLHVHGHSLGRAELLGAHGTLEVLGLLMLDQYLLVVKLAVAVPAPRLDHHLFLLLGHCR